MPYRITSVLPAYSYGMQESGGSSMSSGDIIGGIGSAIGSIGNLITGGIGAYQTAKWNEKGYKLSKAQFEYNKQWNERQMQWLDDMARTAHQREVADLRAAGLNPILSGLGGSGAPMVGSVSAPHPTASYSSGAGAVAQGWQTAMSGISSAAQILQGYNRLANEGLVAEATAKKLETEAAFSAKQVNRYDHLIDGQIDKLQSSAKADRAKAEETLELLFAKKDSLIKQAERDAAIALKNRTEESYLGQKNAREWTNTAIYGIESAIDAFMPKKWLRDLIDSDGSGPPRVPSSRSRNFGERYLRHDRHRFDGMYYDSETQTWRVRR